ncbi:MAG: SNF2-related protein [Candidatus Eisenbacteria bacterium]
MAQTQYRVGDRVHHQAFGEGLVVDVRSRDFFDVLEIAFSDAVRKVTSIHPQLSKDEATAGGGGRSLHPSTRMERMAPADEDGPAAGPVEVEPGQDGPLSRRHILDPAAFPFERSAILHLEAESIAPFLKRNGVPASDPQAFLLHLEALQLRHQRGFSRLLALHHTRDVQRLEHQIRACLRVLREMKGRALLADEVGLGKTIEAGLILKEYALRGLVRRALILVPASLVTQWREELAHKFGLPVQLYGRGIDWSGHDFLIASLDTAKSARNRRAIAAAGFDLLVVDEAHRLRNHLTQAWKFIDSLSLKYLLLLTATPVQNDLRELYNLVTLLRPGVLGTYRVFRNRFVVRGDRRLPKNTPQLSRLLADVMIRTTRSSTSIKFPRRAVETIHLDLSPAEELFYREVSAFVRRMAQSEEQDRSGLPWPLLLMVLQKEIGSSPEAAIGTLERAAAGRLHRVRGELAGLLEVGRRVEGQAKLERLAAVVEEKRRQGEKVLVFSQFRRTVEAVARALEGRGVRVGRFHGGLTLAAKDAVIASFQGPLDVLVSTEAGGEGRNLQFCRTLVNYDLPWNPMRIEQRIGRIHRIGQTRDVQIVNMAARGTLEAYVLRVLQEKISMFQLVIGEMDQILGNLEWTEPFETHVFRLWANHDEGQGLDHAFGDLGQELERARQRYEHVKAYDREVFEGAGAFWAPRRPDERSREAVKSEEP